MAYLQAREKMSVFVLTFIYNCGKYGGHDALRDKNPAALMDLENTFL